MKTIDERIVDMQFNNKQFEDGIQTSLKSLDGLKKGLDDTGKGGSLGAIQSGVETISSKFSALGIMGVTALQNIASSAVEAGAKLVKSLSTDNIKAGFDEYELKMGSIQTIMAGTGESLDTVNRYLDELNTYADKTIYSFSDMTSNIGKFTNAGVKLKDAVGAIQGVSNAAALAGANASQASHAMYNFAQALSAGYVKLIDWKSIENANMATVEFKTQLLEAGVATGTVAKQADGMYQVLTKNGKDKAMAGVIDATHDFNDSLAYQWMTTEVLVATLNDYADETTEIGKRAFAAAQDVKTFTQLLDTVKESVGSGWAKTFEILIGDFNEAKELFTSINKVMDKFVGNMSDSRNELLAGALSSGWKQLMAEGIADSTRFIDIVTNVAREQGIAIDEMIKDSGSFEKTLKSGWLTSGMLSESISTLTTKISEMSEEELEEAGYTREAVVAMESLDAAVKDGSTSMEDFASKIASASGREILFEGLANVIKYLGEVLKPIIEGFRQIFPPMTSERLLAMIVAFRDFTTNLKLGDETADKLKRTFAGLFAAFDIVGQAIGFLWGKFQELRAAILPSSEGVLAFTANIGDFLVKLNDTIRTSDTFNKAFDAVKTVVLDVVGAIRDGLDRLTKTEAFKTLQELVGKAVEKIKEAPEAIRAAFDGVRTTILKVVDAVKEDFQGLTASSAFQTLQDLVGKAADKIKEAFDKIKEAFGTAADKIKEAFEKIKETFGGFGGIDLSGAKSFVDGATENFRPFTALGTGLSAAFDVIRGVYEKVAPIFEKLATILGNAFGKLKDAVVGAFDSGGIQGVLDLINGGIFAAILLGLRKFIGNLSDFTSGAKEGFEGLIGGAGDILTGITGILDGVKDSLVTYQNSIKAKTLLTIATAVGVLAAALVVLSLIDAEKLTVAMLAISTLFIELAGTMIILQKSMGNGQMVKVAGEMIVMSVAILILSVAMKSLAELDWDGITRGAAGVGILAAELVLAAKALSKNASKMTSAGVGLIAFSAAILILAQAVEQLGSLDADAMVQGLSGVGGLMVEIAGFTQIVKPEKLMSTGVAMIAMGAAMLILASAVGDLGALDVEALAKGLIAMAAIFAEIAGFTQIVKPEKLVSTGVAMIAMGAAMLILGNAIAQMGEMKWDEIARGLAAMAGALGVMVLALNLMPEDVGVKALSLLVFSAALVVLAQAMQMMGGMTWEDIAQSLVVLAGSLTVITLAMNLMTGALSGAAAMLVMSAALLVLAPALMMLGSMDLAEIGLALLALVGVFAIVGVSGLVLAPLVPVILALAAAIALLGVGVAAIGVGLLAFSAGLTALAVAGGAGATALVLIVTELISLIPMIIEKLGEGIILFAGVIKEGMPAIVEALKALFEGLIQILGELLPPLIDTVLEFIDDLLLKLVKYVPQFVDSGMKIIDGFIQGIADNIGDVVDSGIDLILGFLGAISDRVSDIGESVVDLITEFMDMLGKETPRLIDAGLKMIIDFINGLADAIDDNAALMGAALGRLAGSIITGIVTGIGNGIWEVLKAIGGLVDSLINKFKSLLGIHSPSSVFDGFAGSIIQGLINGLGSGISSVVDKVKEVGQSLLDGFKNLLGINSPSTVFNEYGGNITDGLNKGMSEGTPSVENESRNVGNAVINTMSGIFDGISAVAGNIIDGLKNGLSGGIKSVTEKAKEVAQSALDGAKNLLGVKSPSTAFMAIGEYSGEGLAIGLASMAGAVGDAAAGVGQSAVDSLGKAISGISDEVGSMDADPTIRPVLDFSDIQAGLAKMDQMFADSKSISLDLSSAIAASNSSAKRGADSESSAGQEAQTVQIVNKFDLTGLTVRSEADIDAIAAKLYQKQQQAMRGRGVRGLALV